MADAFAPFTFVHSNRRVVFGWDSLERLPELAKEFGARRPAAILDGYFTRTPVGARIAALLSEGTGAAPLVHATPATEPDTASVEACAAALAAVAPDFIVAVGGGSAMDTAKVARMLL
jgi:alcohol dehydrogenase class IV